MAKYRDGRRITGRLGMMDKPTGVAGEHTEEAEREEDVPTRQHRKSPMSRKRKSVSPGGTRAAAAGDEAGATASSGDSGAVEVAVADGEVPRQPARARRIRRTARKTIEAWQAQDAEIAAQEEAAAAAAHQAGPKRRLNFARRSRDSPRNPPEPAGNQDEPAIRAAVQVLPVHVDARSQQATSARTAHPAEFAYNVLPNVFDAAPPAPVLLAAPRKQRREPLPPLQGMGAPRPQRQGAEARAAPPLQPQLPLQLQGSPQAPPQLQPQLAQAPPPARAPVQERASASLQPPQPNQSPPPRVMPQTEVLDSDDEPNARGSANSSVGPVSSPLRQDLALRRAAWVSAPMAQCPFRAAAQGYVGGNAPPAEPPQVPSVANPPRDMPRGRRIAQGEVLNFSPMLPLAPRIPKALVEMRTAPARARDSSDSDCEIIAVIHNASAAAADRAAAGQEAESLAGEGSRSAAACSHAMAPVEGEQEDAAVDGEVAAGVGEGPAYHIRSAPCPCGSSESESDLTEMSSEDESEDPAAQGVRYPNGHKRMQNRKTFSLNSFVNRPEQDPALAAPMRLPPPMQMAQNLRAAARMQPTTPEGLPARAELVSGKKPARPPSAQEKGKTPAVDDAESVWQLNDMAGEEEAGPSSPHGSGISRKRAAKQQSSPRKVKKRKVQQPARASPHKPMRMFASGYVAVSPDPTPEKALDAAADVAAEAEEPQQAAADVAAQPEASEHNVSAPLAPLPAPQVAEPAPEGETDEQRLLRTRPACTLYLTLAEKLENEAAQAAEVRTYADLVGRIEHRQALLSLRRVQHMDMMEAYERARANAANLLHAAADVTQLVQDTEAKIAALQEELRGYIIDCERKRAAAAAAERNERRMLEDLEAHETEVSRLLCGAPAVMENIDAVLAHQQERRAAAGSTHKGKSWRLEATRTTRVNVQRELIRRGLVPNA